MDIRLHPIQISDVKALLAASTLNPVHQARMLAAACSFKRTFKITPLDAPGAFIFGAQATPQCPDWQNDHVAAINCSGAGFTQSEALIACMGEAVELLSQFEQGDERSFGAADGINLIDHGETLDMSGIHIKDQRFMAARCLVDGSVSGLALGLCIRPYGNRLYGKPAFPLGLGGGAGPDLDQAILHGLLELIERDAAALWWRGGVPGRVLALAGPELAQAMALLAKARKGADAGRHIVVERQLLILEISREFGVPVVAALSSDAEGRGLACGLAARADIGQACRAAIKEMLQMELAQKLALAKKNEAGHAALNAVDLRHLAQNGGPGIHDLALPLFGKAAMHHAPLASGGDTGQVLRSLVANLAASGISVHAVDLTRARYGISAARVFSAELQPEPSHITTPRLASAWKLHGEKHRRYAELHPLL